MQLDLSKCPVIKTSKLSGLFKHISTLALTPCTYYPPCDESNKSDNIGTEHSQNDLNWIISRSNCTVLSTNLFTNVSTNMEKIMIKVTNCTTFYIPPTYSIYSCSLINLYSHIPMRTNYSYTTLTLDHPPGPCIV